MMTLLNVFFYAIAPVAGWFVARLMWAGSTTDSFAKTAAGVWTIFWGVLAITNLVQGNWFLAWAYTWQVAAMIAVPRRADLKTAIRRVATRAYRAFCYPVEA